MTEPNMRTLRADELHLVAEVVAAAFLDDEVADLAERVPRMVDADRVLGVFDGDQLVGTGSLVGKRITLPGAGRTPVAGVTLIAVAPGHRRRGVLSTIMRRQLTELHERRGEALAALWSSEVPIYGRFGYGAATDVVDISVPGKAPFRPGVDLGTDRVVEAPRAQAEPRLRELYDATVDHQVGALERDDLVWAHLLHDTPARRRGLSANRFALHPGGYARFRTTMEWTSDGPRGQASVAELVASTPVAYAALVRYLLDVDLVGTVRLRGSTQEPLTALLHDSRTARRTVTDALWLRIVDLPRALPLRGYATAVDLVLAVTDELCPWNAGRWRLRAGGDGAATVTATDDDADLALGIAELGAVFLGHVRPDVLCTAGRVRELRSGAVGEFGRALVCDTVPYCGEIF